jgi:hypothetical protein
MKEQVNHPSHYKRAGRKECIEEIEEIFGVVNACKWAIINAYKYLYRAGSKDGNSFNQDMAKAEWFLDYANKRCADLDCKTVMHFCYVKNEYERVRLYHEETTPNT